MTIDTQLALDGLATVDLATVLEVAPLARRTDRKYLVPTADAARLVESLADSHRILEIEGRRCTSYRSTYFDTAELRLCRDHLQGRRLRWKARSRLYVEDRLCRFEVKVKGDRGETVKCSVDVDADAYGRLGPDELAFLAEALGERRTEAGRLHPTLEVGYSRATLVDLVEGTRLTFDHGVVGRPTPTAPTALRPGAVSLDLDHVIVETKSGPRPGQGDRVLAAMGHRPLALSKYTTSAALLATGVADNHVRRLVGRGVTVRHDLGRAS
ncbi:MAG: polyphosphate polymerase domain-containing protein [Nocardioidaceae bacterium]